jgi:hypothetical protein
MSGLYSLSPAAVFPGDCTYITMDILERASQNPSNEGNPSTPVTTSTETTEQT